MVFGEEDFLASDYLLGNKNDTVTVLNDSTGSLMEQNEANTYAEVNNLPGTSAQVQNTLPLSEFTNPPQGPFNLWTPSKSILSPLPFPMAKNTRKGANTKQHSTILTATPLKSDLENKERKKKEKLSKDSKQICQEKTNIVKKTRQPKKKNKSRHVYEFSSSDEEVLASKIKKDNYLKAPILTSSSIDDDDDSDDISTTNESETLCLICREFGKNEVWFRCRGCGRWAHKACSGADDPVKYVYDYCQPKQKVLKRLDL